MFFNRISLKALVEKYSNKLKMERLSRRSSTFFLVMHVASFILEVSANAVDYCVLKNYFIIYQTLIHLACRDTKYFMKPEKQIIVTQNPDKLKVPKPIADIRL